MCTKTCVDERALRVPERREQCSVPSEEQCVAVRSGGCEGGGGGGGGRAGLTCMNTCCATP